jgi:hypothetical protein
MRNLLILFVLSLSIGLQGQNSFRSTPYKVTKKRVVKPREIKPNLFDPQIVAQEAPYPGGNSYKDFLFRQKLKVEKAFPRKESLQSFSTSRSAAENPILLDSMGIKWNHPNGPKLVVGGTPNDNSIAASENYLITAWNSRIYYHDLKADTPMINPSVGHTYISFGAFAGSITTSSTFDPKILYDASQKRFILMFLSIDRSDRNATSKTVVGFSSTENPMDPWHVYEIDGNPRKDGHWSDYPQIALSENELFFTINLLDGGDWVTDFKETIIWQIDKNSGYRGDSTLTSVLWDSIMFAGKPVRYIHPMDFSDPKGHNNMFFLSNNAVPVNPGDTTKFSYDSLTLVEITNSIASGNAKLMLSGDKPSIKIHTPPLGRQPAGGEPFWTNDCRILGGFYHNSLIQFVGMTADTSNGNAGIFHGFAEIGSASFQSSINIISDPAMDLGYPNIAYVKTNKGEHCSMIGFNHSGPNNPAGMSSLFYQSNTRQATGDYSDIVRLFDGKNYVNTFMQGNERWGDYLGMQTNPSVPSQVWMAGYYGQINNTPGVYVSKVSLSPIANTKQNTQNQSSTKVFPNPSNTRFELEFNNPQDQLLTFELYDIQGKLVEQVHHEYINAGVHRLTFETFHLEPGSYVIKITNDGRLLESQRVVVSH